MFSNAACAGAATMSAAATMTNIVERTFDELECMRPFLSFSCFACTQGADDAVRSEKRRLSYLAVRNGLLTLLLSALSCAAAPSPTLTPAQLANVPAALQQPQPGDDLIVAAGDIARCGPQLANARATAAIVQQFPSATVLTIGDNAYERGRPDEFANCYDPTWGAFKSRTH